MIGVFLWSWQLSTHNRYVNFLTRWLPHLGALEKEVVSIPEEDWAISMLLIGKEMHLQLPFYINVNLLIITLVFQANKGNDKVLNWARFMVELEAYSSLGSWAVFLLINLNTAWTGFHLQTLAIVSITICGAGDLDHV